MRAAPVVWSRQAVSDGVASAVVLNSGGANACTGPDGLKDAQLTATRIAASLNLKPTAFFVCSTGRIGQPLPMPKLLKGLERTVTDKGRTADHGHKAASAILTSDTKAKTVTVSFTYDGKKHFVSGIAKGAGMIQPNMATMLAFLATDFSVPRSFLQKTLSEAVTGTFNCITVDGDMSTNDTLLLLASGSSGVKLTAADGAFVAALTDVCIDLSRQIARDGEGATRLIEIRVSGAADEAQAHMVGDSIARSPLFKCAVHGGDPNWDRVLCAAGYLHPLAARGRLYVWGSRVPSKPGELLTLLRERHVPGLESPTSTRRARPIQLDKWAVDTASQAPKQPTPAQILLRSRHRDLRS